MILYTLRREFIYIWYYFDLQLRQIFPYWLLGILIGSLISVFFSNKIHGLVRSLSGKKFGILGIIPASILGIASPLCMYGTIPLAASLSRSGIRDDCLAAFMMSSILLNPQLIIYSTALGFAAFTVRIVSCLLCGVSAGLLVHIFRQNTTFFNFSGSTESKSRDIHPNPFIRLLKNIGRNFKATGPWFMLGLLLSALFQRYVPANNFAQLFGSNEGYGILMAATIGVPLYLCGGGTIPLLQQWLWNGMSMGSAAAFMITGPATKITNLGALKIVMGGKHFALYLAYIIVFSVIAGLSFNLIA